MNSPRYGVILKSEPVNTERFGYEEIVYLLNLCEKYGIINQSQSKKYSLVRAFTPIHNEMIEAGYNRSLTQVIDKFRKLKLRFVHAYLARKKGKTAMASRFEHYRRFERLLDHAKVDIDIFIKKFSKKEDNFEESNSTTFQITKDDSNSRTNLDYEDVDTISMVLDENEVEKEIHLDEEFQDDYTIDDYRNENIDIKILPNKEPSTSFTAENNNKPNQKIAERTLEILEQLVPSFKKAQQELQTQFFKQQKELQRQQQEWEERILDEEREYFTKVLSTLNNLTSDD